MAGAHHDIVLLGGSKGSRLALGSILRELPADFPAALLVVQHRAEGGGSLLKEPVAMPARFAEDGETLEHSKVYFAPPNRHLLFEDGVLRVRSGPRENLARPSIDVSFRSAAVTHGPRVIGVLLSGTMDDGVAGLLAIRRCRGVTVVQTPTDALADELPRRGLLANPTFTAPAAEISQLLRRLVPEAAPEAAPVPSDLALEARAAANAMSDLPELQRLAEATHLTCPECDGPMWRLPAEPNDHYRCEVGHAFSPAALFSDQGRRLERALWVAYRTLTERARLLERMAQNDEQRGQRRSASGYTERLREVREHANAVLAALSDADPEETDDDGA